MQDKSPVECFILWSVTKMAAGHRSTSKFTRHTVQDYKQLQSMYVRMNVILRGVWVTIVIVKKQ